MKIICWDSVEGSWQACWRNSRAQCGWRGGSKQREGGSRRSHMGNKIPECEKCFKPFWEPRFLLPSEMRSQWNILMTEETWCVLKIHSSYCMTADWRGSRVRNGNKASIQETTTIKGAIHNGSVEQSDINWGREKYLDPGYILKVAFTGFADWLFGVKNDFTSWNQKNLLQIPAAMFDSNSKTEVTTAEAHRCIKP